MVHPPGPHSRGAAPSAPRHAVGGFTLIELMIAIVVIGILAAVAYPSFMDSVRKSRRSEAVTALMQVQQAQERWRGNHAAYATSVTAEAADDGLTLPGTTPNGYYTLSLDAADADGYTARAVGNDGTSQADDSSCRVLRLRLDGGNLSYGGCASGDCPLAVSDPCWVR